MNKKGSNYMYKAQESHSHILMMKGGGGGFPSDFFGSEIFWPKVIFGSMKDAGIFLGSKKTRGIFLGCEKRT